MHGIPFSGSPERIAPAMEMPHAPCGKMHLQMVYIQLLNVQGIGRSID